MLLLRAWCEQSVEGSSSDDLHRWCTVLPGIISRLNPCYGFSNVLLSDFKHVKLYIVQYGIMVLSYELDCHGWAKYMWMCCDNMTELKWPPIDFHILCVFNWSFHVSIIPCITILTPSHDILKWRCVSWQPIQQQIWWYACNIGNEQIIWRHN